MLTEYYIELKLCGNAHYKHSHFEVFLPQFHEQVCACILGTLLRKRCNAYTRKAGVPGKRMDMSLRII
jgi:hypothetical protein